MNLDFNYDGKTKLKDWWGKVKANFQTVQDGFNNLDSKVDEEISNRETADAQLKEEIESEKEQRQANDDYLLEILNDRVPLIIADTLPDVVISLVGVMGANSYSLGSIGVKRGDVNEYYILSKINTVPGPKTTYKLTWEKIPTIADVEEKIETEINTLNEVIEMHSLQLSKEPENLSDYMNEHDNEQADFPQVVGTKLYIVNDLGYDVTELRAGGDTVWKFSKTLIDGEIYMLEIVKEPVSGADWENGEINVVQGDLCGLAENVLNTDKQLENLTDTLELTNSDVSDIKSRTTAAESEIDILQEDVAGLREEQTTRTAQDNLLYELIRKTTIHNYSVSVNSQYPGQQLLDLSVNSEFIFFNDRYNAQFPDEVETYSSLPVNDEIRYTLTATIEPHKAYKCKIISQADVSVDGHNGEIEVIGEFTDSDAYNEINNKLEILSAPVNHRNIFRGKNLGNAVTEAQKTAIQSGTFDDLFVGDYWEIDGINWRIVDMDYWAKQPAVPDEYIGHHLVIMPDENLYDSVMNSEQSTEGGFINSTMYKTGLEQAKTKINNIFTDMIINYDDILSNEVTDGKVTGSQYVPGITVTIPNERMILGTQSIEGFPIKNVIDTEILSCSATQFSLFKLSTEYIYTLGDYWLRDIYDENCYGYISSSGMLGISLAYYPWVGVRPVFAIG